MNLNLPKVTPPLGNYLTAIEVEGWVYSSGALPLLDGTLQYTGAVSTIKEGQKAAKLACQNALSGIQNVIGDLNRVTQIVKVTVFVNSGTQFTEHPAVANGASDYLAEVFGNKGRHARAAVGVSSLPLNSMVEVELSMRVGP